MPAERLTRSTAHRLIVRPDRFHLALAAARLGITERRVEPAQMRLGEGK